ncbi:hypothetical protein BYT27DRAFT_7108919 [Phlegmacium glaucopus]|nr:hypothetical protein BYT27DRAFT_7108919 [Phlegmacium glaucopus]
MPRILPRLNAQIEKQASHPKFFPLPKRERRNSLYRPLPQIPSFHPADYPTSILLTPANPITNSWNYKRHKTLPPATAPPSLWDSSQTDKPREMTSDEFRWWSNPYLRMLASPLRQCIVTNRVLPSDFLIRLAAMRVPTSRLPSGGKAPGPQGLLAPDGILHSKYTHRKAGRASYILCWRGAVLKLQKGSFKRISPHVTYSPRLPDYIAHLLRLRVLQELELLAERLEYRVKTHKHPKVHSSVILRRLTRAEWGLMRSSGFIPYQDALAVLIVPPVNKDVVTGSRPEGSMSVAPTEINDRAKPATRPLSVLMPTGSHKVENELAPQMVSSPVVPLYNGATAFPNRFQRSALYSILVRILVSERLMKKRLRGAGASPGNEGVESAKASHAFLLCSDDNTGKLGDVAGVARALWRLRMFEGEGWQHSC